jgi:hypothetical protein
VLLGDVAQRAGAGLAQTQDGGGDQLLADDLGHGQLDIVFAVGSRPVRAGGAEGFVAVDEGRAALLNRAVPDGEIPAGNASQVDVDLAAGLRVGQTEGAVGQRESADPTTHSW